jgi:hypothetical protein
MSKNAKTVDGMDGTADFVKNAVPLSLGISSFPGSRGQCLGNSDGTTYGPN